jgi:Ala-tRNA(Pro) deacylase
MRIAKFLAETQVPFEPLPHPPAFTAQQRAKYLGLPGRQVGKCVLLRGPVGHLLAVLPATHQVDTKALSAALDGPVRLAGHHDIAEVFRDCEWGVVPPFGGLYGLQTVIDESLEADALLVLETHTHVDAIRLLCRDFERLERPKRLRFAREVAKQQVAK